MDEHIFDKVQEVDMQKTMKDYYIDYAMSERYSFKSIA